MTSAEFDQEIVVGGNKVVNTWDYFSQRHLSPMQNYIKM